MKSGENSIPDPCLSKRQFETLRLWLDENVLKYNHPAFIPDDPVSVPHRFSNLQDIEIAAFFAAIMSWGQRKTIVRKANELMRLMDDAPYDFIRYHQEHDRQPLISFKHRTLQPDDILYLVDVLQQYYQHHASLEHAFTRHLSPADEDVYNGLAGFYTMVFDQPYILERTRKHIATPVRKSSCKRMNMFLRWMVRRDDRGVDFGLWRNMAPSQLIIPLDLHVGMVARRMGLLKRTVNDWQAAKELTMQLRQFDALDPVKYDFALFGVGINP